MAEHGFAAEAAAIAAAWSQGDRRATERAVGDAMIDATSIAGTAEACRARLAAYRQSGIDVPIIPPFARSPDAKARFEAAIRACAPGQNVVRLSWDSPKWAIPMRRTAGISRSRELHSIAATAVSIEGGSP